MRFFLFLIILFGALLGGGVYAFSKYAHVNPWTFSFYETDAPTIVWLKAPKGLGADVNELVLEVTDKGAGLDAVIVRMIQRDNRRDLLKREFANAGVRKEAITVPLDSRLLGLKEGDIEISVSAFDKSLWSNSAQGDLKLKVDFVKPRIEVLTPQQNSALGGAELVFYRVVGRTVQESGVDASGVKYPGFPAVHFDSSFKGYTNVYAALYPIPFDFDDSKDRLRVFVEDDFGNRAVAPFNYRIAKRRFTTDSISLSDAFLTSKVPELFPKLQSATPLQKDGSSTQKFAAINEELRKENESTIREVLKGAQEDRLWKAPFVRPMAATPKASFAEQRTYTYQGSSVSRSMHMGVDLAAVAQSPVVAAADGRVLYADDLGIYGYAVIVDHGFGLSSLYGHLSTIGIKKGDVVVAGSEIGRTGATGLAGGDHLHFELRLHGVPVTPIEWWDTKWLADHITEKSAMVKRTLVGGSAE